MVHVQQRGISTTSPRGSFLLLVVFHPQPRRRSREGKQTWAPGHMYASRGRKQRAMCYSFPPIYTHKHANAHIPELTTKTLVISPPVLSTSIRASSSPAPVPKNSDAQYATPVSSCRTTASRTSWLWWPRHETAAPEVASRIVWPVERVTVAPEADVTRGGSLRRVRWRTELLDCCCFEAMVEVVGGVGEKGFVFVFFFFVLK